MRFDLQPLTSRMNKGFRIRIEPESEEEVFAVGMLAGELKQANVAYDTIFGERTLLVTVVPSDQDVLKPLGAG